MPLASLHAPFDNHDWIFELKYFRALGYIDSGRCWLVSRRGPAYKSFPQLCAAIGAAIPGQAVLDGEIVHLDAQGKPRFYDLMRRRTPQHYYAFDLLWLDGRDLRELPLIEGKQRLKRLIRPPALYVDHIERRGMDLFEATCGRDLEGILRSHGGHTKIARAGKSGRGETGCRPLRAGRYYLGQD
jgi:bifunctional non-homologous end joining protein LigD